MRAVSLGLVLLAWRRARLPLALSLCQDPGIWPALPGGKAKLESNLGELLAGGWGEGIQVRKMWEGRRTERKEGALPCTNSGCQGCLESERILKALRYYLPT